MKQVRSYDAEGNLFGTTHHSIFLDSKCDFHVICDVFSFRVVVYYFWSDSKDDVNRTYGFGLLIFVVCF